ncbi:hypothetical protein [Neorickettsia findlayensis]|uniref:Uncharacterized protein n=1 Tax=Neorickettsia findlayensis TaxID=2686014 RepID=A0A6P1GAJ7_9RICK|nr:hypothetical protein [Neorickettsia findlayensis]QHD64951.1 hypothetical protein GP480_00490 [Neorickettsia findlayensis]
MKRLTMNLKSIFGAQTLHTNLKEALLSKNARAYDRVVYFARYFKLTTKRDLASPEAQRSVFGRVLGNPNSVEVQTIMLVFLREHFGDSYQTCFLTKEDKEKFARIGEAIGLSLLARYYSGERHNVLHKLRILRAAASIILLLVTLGLVILFALHLANKMHDVCTTPTRSAEKITLMIAIGVIALLSTVLYLWETAKPKDFDNYKPGERSKEALLDKLSPHIMRNPVALYLFSSATIVLMACLCAAGDIVENTGGLRAELAFAIVLAILATSLVCVMANAWYTSAITPLASRPRIAPELYECDVANGLPDFQCIR